MLSVKYASLCVSSFQETAARINAFHQPGPAACARTYDLCAIKFPKSLVAAYVEFVGSC
mgnify:CR=1 FL=1